MRYAKKDIVDLFRSFRKEIVFMAMLCFAQNCFAQKNTDSLSKTLPTDTLHRKLDEIVVSASRFAEMILFSPVSIEQLRAKEANKMGAPTCFDAIGNMKGVQVLTPSLGFKVINTRGFSNTTNVRFTQLIDGVDNQAPHIGAPIANALGANDLDIEKIEIIPGTASALYGMNAINGLVNVQTKNPFDHQGLNIQQLSGFNHVGEKELFSTQYFNHTNFRYGQAINKFFAFKVNGSYMKGTDWIADDQADLGSSLNYSVGLTGTENPAYDEVNSYGNEAPNRRTLTLNGKKYVVGRTGYREKELADYSLSNFKGDLGFYFRPTKGHEAILTYKGALINTLYQRSNRFRLENYQLHQFGLSYHAPKFEFKTYLTQENTGRSYNLRSLAENLDRSFKSDNQWFTDYTNSFNSALANGSTIPSAHAIARSDSDAGRFVPGTEDFERKKDELTKINNWDEGAALRVKSNLFHVEGLMHWDKIFPGVFQSIGLKMQSGFDHRSYIIIPDGNYFINPTDSSKNLLFGKTGFFTQINKELFQKKIRLSAMIRMDKADYFTWKFNPRFTAVYAPSRFVSIRGSYQNGYRFPSIFEGFSNVNSGGVKRVGGLRVMSDGIFENSYTKASIDEFQMQVNNDVNTLGLNQAQAIEKNQGILKKNPYTYLKPEFIRSIELGIRGLILNEKIMLDADFYYNSYSDFIAQVEANVPRTTIADSIPTYLYTKTGQDRYRLWTNSNSKIYNYGSSLGIRYKYSEKYSFQGNVSFSKLDRKEEEDGLEDGYNTPQWILNGTISGEKIWKELGVSITAKYQNKFEYVSFLVSGEVKAFWSIDAQLNYFFRKPNLTVKLGATNLLNKSYVTLLGGPSIGGLYYLSLVYEMKRN